jgi:hypothetical protein
MTAAALAEAGHPRPVRTHEARRPARSSAVRAPYRGQGRRGPQGRDGQRRGRQGRRTPAGSQPRASW